MSVNQKASDCQFRIVFESISNFRSGGGQHRQLQQTKCRRSERQQIPLGSNNNFLTTSSIKNQNLISLNRPRNTVLETVITTLTSLSLCNSTWLSSVRPFFIQFATTVDRMVLQNPKLKPMLAKISDASRRTVSCSMGP